MIGMRLAGELGLDAADRSALFYALLLKDDGCSSTAARVSVEESKVAGSRPVVRSRQISIRGVGISSLSDLDA